MNNYELTIVLDSKAGAPKKKKVVDGFEKVLETFKGKVTSSADWGVKELAYKIGKSESGLYLFYELDLDPKGVKALNEKLRTDADVLRFLLINKDK